MLVFVHTNLWRLNKDLEITYARSGRTLLKTKLAKKTIFRISAQGMMEVLNSVSGHPYGWVPGRFLKDGYKVSLGAKEISKLRENSEQLPEYKTYAPYDAPGYHPC